jgi:hypothetical protein
MLMIAEDLNLDILHFSAIVLTLALLTARIASKKDGSFLKWFVAGAFLGIIALPLAIVKRQHVALTALKKCPKCDEQLPLSALVCDVCDYNFISRMVGHPHKLPPPSDEASGQTLASPA